MSIIPPAILPASAQLLLAISPQGEIGGIPALESRFSALLEAQIGASLLSLAGDTESVPAPVKLPDQSQAPLNGKLPGKATGKILPELPQFAEVTRFSLGEDTSPPGELVAAFAEDSQTDAASAAKAALLPQPQPLPIDIAVVPVPDQSALAQSVPQPGSAKSEAAPVAVVEKIEPGLIAPIKSYPAEPRAFPARPAKLTAPDAPEAAAAPAVTPLALRTFGQKLLASIAPALKSMAPTRPALPHGQEIRIAPAPASAPALAETLAPIASPQVIQPALVARSILAAPGPSHSAKPAQRTVAEADSFSPAPTVIAVGGVANAVAAIGVAVIEPPVPQAVATAALGPAAAPRPMAAQLGGAPLDLVPAASEPAAIKADHPASPVPAQQVAPSPLETAPLLPAGQIAAPAIAAPPTTAPAAAPAPHDFAALIDRLVEARQTAQATLAVQTVNAAVTHAEFGQVSLQFRQDADGLSVVMAGTDPDLARAVQIAAPAAQTGTQTGGNENHAAPRHDLTSPHQAQSQAQMQSQTQQHRGQSPQHRSDDPRANANPSPRQRSQDDMPARGGIFA